MYTESGGKDWIPESTVGQTTVQVHGTVLCSDPDRILYSPPFGEGEYKRLSESEHRTVLEDLNTRQF